jgi:hypothetical protein
MLGLTALSALSAMAFVGVTSAMAETEAEQKKVVVCSVLENPCQTAHHLGTGTILHGQLAAGTTAQLLGPTNVTCTASTTLGVINELLAHGEITALGFSGCTEEEGKACTTTTEHLNYLVRGELKSGGGGYELLVTEKAGAGRPEVKVKCGSFLECSYGAATVLLEQLHDTVNNDAVLDVLQLLTGLGLCGFAGTGTWHAQYLTRCLNPVNTTVPCWLAMEA